jgi:uncharacterized SAM-binding protein YcdF (DUF218 family)
MDPVFVLKKIVSLFLGPVALVLELILLGASLYALSRIRPSSRFGIRKAGRRRCMRRSGLALVISGAVLLYLAGTGPVAGKLAYSLESRFVDSIDEKGEYVFKETPEFIVVLAGGTRTVAGKPVLSRLTPHGMARVVGAVDLWKQYPEAVLVLTGRPDETGPMNQVAVRLGVPAGQIIKETESRDTKDHPRYVKKMIGEAPIALVTSAMHMPRAAGLFRKQGLHPQLAPVDFVVWPKTGDFDPENPDSLLPKASNLYLTSKALHEILGLRWAAMRGQLGE